MDENLSTLQPLAKAAVECNACFADRRLHRTFVNLPQPRYIGPGYWRSPRRVAFVMLNPGAGQDDWRNADWKAELFWFREGAGSLDGVFVAQRKHMPFWSSGKLIDFVEQHGLDVDDLALVNIAWCATKENKYPVWMLNQCFQRHTAEWLKRIAPSVVVLSGAASHRFEGDILELLPGATVLTSFHYAHRPVDADKASARAREIAIYLNGS